MHKGQFLGLTMMGKRDGSSLLGALFYDGSCQTVGGLERSPVTAVPISDGDLSITSAYLRTKVGKELCDNLEKHNRVGRRDIIEAFGVAAYHKVRAEVSGNDLSRGVLPDSDLKRIARESGPDTVRNLIRQHDLYSVYRR